MCNCLCSFNYFRDTTDTTEDQSLLAANKTSSPATSLLHDTSNKAGETADVGLPPITPIKDPDKSDLREDSISHDKKRSNTLQRGLKSMRHSLKKKKKKHLDIPDAFDTTSIASKDEQTPVKHIAGIRTENMSTPKPTATIEVQTLNKSSKSPFHRIGSLRKPDSESPFKRLTKMGGSLRVKQGSLGKLNFSHHSRKIHDESQPIKSKEELVTTSIPYIDDSRVVMRNDPYTLNDPSRDSCFQFEESNPFSSRSKYKNLNRTNPFYSSDNALAEEVETEELKYSSNIDFTDKPKKKGFRKSVRKTFNRIGSIRKDKKNNRDEKKVENIKLNDMERGQEKEALLNKDLVNNRLNTVTQVTAAAPCPEIIPREPKLETVNVASPTRYNIVTDELLYKIIQLQVWSYYFSLLVVRNIVIASHVCVFNNSGCPTPLLLKMLYYLLFSQLPFKCHRRTC